MKSTANNASKRPVARIAFAISIGLFVLYFLNRVLDLLLDEPLPLINQGGVWQNVVLLTAAIVFLYAVCREPNLLLRSKPSRNCHDVPTMTKDQTELKNRYGIIELMYVFFIIFPASIIATFLIVFTLYLFADTEKMKETFLPYFSNDGNFWVQFGTYFVIIPVLALLIIGLVPTGVLTLRRFKSTRREFQKHGLCGKCYFPFQPQNSTCPECGHEFKQDTSTSK